MSNTITATRVVKSVTVNATRDGKTITLQPVISKSSSGDAWDGIVNGGTP